MPSRIASFDVLKVPAIIAVIWLHVNLFKGPEYDHTLYRYAILIADLTARFAVPFFFLVSGYLYAQALQRANAPWPLLQRYSRRLLALFVIWSLIYAVIPPTRDTPIAIHLHDVLVLIKYHPLKAIILGLRPHLWFLMALVCSLTFLTFWIWLGYERIALVGATGLYGMHLMLNPYSLLDWSMPTQNTPMTACIFVVLGWRLAKDPITSVAAAWSLWIGGFIFTGIEVLVIHRVQPNGIIFHPFLFGTVPFGVGIFSLALQNPKFGEGTIFATLGALTVGVYVSHMLVLDFINHLRFSWNSPIIDLLMPFSTYVICIVLILFYQRLLRRLLNTTLFQRLQTS